MDQFDTVYGPAPRSKQMKSVQAGLCHRLCEQNMTKTSANVPSFTNAMTHTNLHTARFVNLPEWRNVAHGGMQAMFNPTPELSVACICPVAKV